MRSILENPLVVIFTATAISIIATYLVRALARRLGFIAKPKSDRWHQRPTAMLGGMAIFFTTIAGYGSQLMTHSIDLVENRQDAAPIAIDEYCFVGTDVVILGGSQLPARSVLGAKALLNKCFVETGWLYAGVPARPIRAVPANAKYFSRADGFVI